MGDSRQVSFISVHVGKIHPLVGAVLLALLASCSETVDLSAEQRDASLSWLAVIDAGEYSESWEETSTLFQSAVSKSDWVKQIRRARGSLGSLSTRAHNQAILATELPAAPDGNYIVITYDSSFAKKASATETHTLYQESDGSWRTAGYFIN